MAPGQGVPAPGALRARPLEGVLKGTARGGRRRGAQDLDGETDGGARFPRRLPEKRCGLLRQRGLVLSHEGGQGGQRPHDPGVILLRQQGEEMVPDAIPEVCVRGVAGIGPIGETARGRVRLDLAPRDGEERPQDPVAQRGHPGQAAGSRSAQQVQQHGLGLVVQGVGDEDAGGPHLRRGGIQAGVPRRPGPHLHRLAPAPLGRIQPAQAGRETSPRRLSHDEGRVPVGRLAPQAVMHVGHVEEEAQPVLEAREDVEERHGVHPARDRHQQALLTRHAGLPEGVRHLIDHTDPAHPLLRSPAPLLPGPRRELSEAAVRRQPNSQRRRIGRQVDSS